MIILKSSLIPIMLLSLYFMRSPIAASEPNQNQSRVGGTIQLDAAFISDDGAELLPGSGTEVRRARFFVSGQHNQVWDYKLRVGFEEDDLNVKDAYLNHNSTGFKIGLFKPAFSIDEMTSSKFITFMEQALPNAFKPGRRISIAYHKFDNDINFNVGVFGQGSAEGDDGDEGFGISSRITSPVLQTKSELLHLGINFSVENPEDDVNSSVSFDARPESHITGNIVDTGIITNTKRIMRSGIEVSSVMQSFSVQAESMKVKLTKNDHSNDLQFSGSYIYASLFLTGEKRPYKASRGVYGRINPINSQGALEIAIRYSVIDLNDGIINGGKASNSAFGVNWYSTNKTRFTMNYIHVKTDHNSTFGNPGILQFRAQIDF